MLENRLRVVPLFRDLPDEGLKSIAARLKWERYPQGAVIFRQGDVGDAMYVVESGQLQVLAEDTNQALAYLGPGSFVGEIALLLGQPRSATLKVVIDADLWVLHKQDLEELLAEHPSVALHFTRELGQRLVTTSHQEAPPKKTPLVTVKGDQWHELVIALTNHTQGSIGLLPLPGSLPLMGGSSSLGVITSKAGIELLEAGLTEQSLTEDLSRQIEAVDHVILILPENPSAMGRKALDLSDYTVHFGPAPDWIQEASPADGLLISDGSPESIQRIARRLTDRTVGVALSSGGSRTVAHIGVVRVLREGGIPIDMIGGSSGGALFGALIAAGWSDQKLVEFARNLGDFNSFRNWDINLPPKAGLIKGRRARDLIEGWLEGRHFSDLEIPLYVVATDLATGQEVVFDSGPVSDAVRASISIPGVTDPWHYRDRYLVDGAFVNPMPASVLHNRGAKIIIGSSVVLTADDPTQPTFEKMPNFLQIISRISSAMETEQIKAEFPLVDVLIHPSVHADHALDFSQADALVALGEEAARQHLAECQSLLAAARVLPRRAERPIQ
ncbi:MAG: patatin-like phospholipase family protein [Anaerolineales bacterium]|nr:MAG: patatin-like phospholipase family protein [Anaerolineales bacterium]